MIGKGITKFRRAGPEASLRNVSRRHFVGISAAAAGVTLGSSLWTPARAEPGEGEPSTGVPDHIPHTNAATAAFGSYHFFFPGHVDGSASSTDKESAVQPNGRDPSVIFNFEGVIGAADLNLSGTGTDLTTGVDAPYTFHTDMRFMAGRFLATDGRVHKGAFVFV